MGEQAYYIRIRGRVLGPYSLEQLAALRKRGQFSRAHEVSSDREAWQSAATLDALLGEPQKGPSKSQQVVGASVAAVAADDSAGPPRGQGPVWHYSLNDQEHGPVTLSGLRSLVAGGQLTADASVWKEGTADWVSVGDVPELSSALKKASPGAAFDHLSQLRDEGIERLDRYSELSSRSVWDGVLKAFRDAVSQDRLRLLGSALLDGGIYALFIAMFLGPVYVFLFFIMGTSGTPPADDRLWVIALGVLIFVVLALAQYVSRRLIETALKLVHATPSRLAGTAFLDVLALFYVLIGAAQIAFWMVAEFAGASDFSRLLPFVAGAGFSFYLAALCLHPRIISVTTADPTSLGEEAVGILSALVKLQLQALPVSFGLCCIVGTIGLSIAILLHFLGAAYALRSFLFAAFSGVLVAVGALLPVVLYLGASFGYVLIDVVRSILILPGKIDRLADSSRSQATSDNER